MKSFLEHLNEEVLPTVQVADGGLDISKPAVRAAINAAIAGVVSQPAVTPYVVFNRLSKLLAQYHIVLPRRFLEGDRGVEVFEVKQFGHKMGMTDSGEFVNEVPATHYLFLQYGILSPFGITYAKPVVGGMFKVMARLVDKEELDKLIDMAEITMSEEAEQMQAIYKANAPREEMHDITSDEKKKGNKAAVAASEKKNLDEDEDPCWDDYKMVGTKKGKRGKPVPNCVLKEKEQINEVGDTKAGREVLKRYRYKAGDQATAAERNMKNIQQRARVGMKQTPYNGDWDKQFNTAYKRRAGIEAANKRINKALDEVTLPQEGPFVKPATNDGHPNVFHPTDAVSYKDSAERMKAGKVYDPHRTEINKDVKEEKGNKVVPGSLSPELQKQVQDLSKDVASGGGASFALKGNPTKTINISGDAPERGNKVGTRAPLDEKAPPGAKFKRMAKHIKAGYVKGGLTDVEKSKAFGATWKAYNRSKMEEGRVEDVMQKPEKEQMKKIAKHAIAHGADIKKLVPQKKKVAEENLQELHGKGSVEKIRAAHYKSANDIAQADEKRLKAIPNPSQRVNNPHADDEIRHHISQVRRADRVKRRLAVHTAKMKEDTQIDETSEKLRLAYTNKAMMQTREKEKKPREHWKRETGIHRAARLMLRDKKKPVNEETDRDTFQDRYNPDYKYTKLNKRDLSLKKHDE